MVAARRMHSFCSLFDPRFRLASSRTAGARLRAPLHRGAMKCAQTKPSLCKGGWILRSKRRKGCREDLCNPLTPTATRTFRLDQIATQGREGPPPCVTLHDSRRRRLCIARSREQDRPCEPEKRRPPDRKRWARSESGSRVPFPANK